MSAKGLFYTENALERNLREAIHRDESRLFQQPSDAPLPQDWLRHHAVVPPPQGHEQVFAQGGYGSQALAEPDIGVGTGMGIVVAAVAVVAVILLVAKR